MKNVNLILFLFIGFVKMTFSQTVTIGNQVWMTNNLNVDKFRNGDPIPQAKNFEELAAYSSAKEAAYCYYEFNTKHRKEFGKMYNGFAMLDPRGLAPEGWKIPTIEDFLKLYEHLGGDKTAMFKLKSKSGWVENKNGTNSSGFNCTPGGITAGNKFGNMGYTTAFLSSTPFDGDGYYRVMVFDVDGLGFSGRYFSNYYYIRCIKE